MLNVVVRKVTGRLSYLSNHNTGQHPCVLISFPWPDFNFFLVMANSIKILKLTSKFRVCIFSGELYCSLIRTRTRRVLSYGYHMRTPPSYTSSHESALRMSLNHCPLDGINRVHKAQYPKQVLPRWQHCSKRKFSLR